MNAVNSDIAVWVIAIDNALSWILVAFFSLFLSLGVLRWKEGQFTGQSIMLLATGLVVYFVISAINEVSLSMLGGQDVDLRVDSVVETWALPVVAILRRYLMSVIVDSLRRETRVEGEASRDLVLEGRLVHASWAFNGDRPDRRNSQGRITIRTNYCLLNSDCLFFPEWLGSYENRYLWVFGMLESPLPPP